MSGKAGAPALEVILAEVERHERETEQRAANWRHALAGCPLGRPDGQD